MGGNSTLQSAPLGRGNDRKIGDFDLRSWQGLTEVLRVAKESIKDPYAYAEFRNAVLEYAQKGGDESLRKGIESTLRSITGETAHKTPTPPPSAAPAHTAPQRDGGVAHKPEHTTPPVAVVPRRPAPSFAPPPSPLPKEQAQSTSKTAPEPPDTVSEAPRPKPTAPVNLPVEQVVSAPVPKSAPAPTPTSEERREETETASSYKSIDMHKARIAEIKRSVHDRIGNPATLIDTHNETGKQYMQALLTALKATGAGSPVGIETAMKNLEMVFTKLLSEGDAPTPKPKAPAPQPPAPRPEVPKQTPSAPVAPKVATFVPPAPKPAAPRQVPIAAQKLTMPLPASMPTPTPVPRPVSAPLPPRVPAEARRPAPSPAPTTARPEVPKVVLRPTPSPAPTPAPVTPSAKPVETPAPPQKQTPTPTAPKFSAPPVPATPPRPRVPETAQKPPTPTSVAPVAPVAVKESTPTPKQVAPAVPPPSRIAPLPRPSVSEDSVRQSELSKPEVTQALENLLNEWPLFKSSGMLGMGPRGVRHPLYVKLAGLSMGEVLAGRFERTDMKAVKIIKEYVLAWRHEQGIAYTINETFEHYLRRVVERILRRQKE